MEGKVKFFDEEKCYGIVENEGGSWFFTGPAIIGDVSKGDAVEFSLMDDPKRSDELMATGVKRIGSAPGADPCRVFIANLPRGVSQRELHDTFERIAAVKSVELILDRETGEPRGFAFIQFESEADARAAIESLNGADWSGRTLTVKRATARSKGNREVGQRA